MSPKMLFVFLALFCTIPIHQCFMDLPNKILNEDQILELILKAETSIRTDFRRDKIELSRTIERLSKSLGRLQSNFDDVVLQNTIMKRELATLKENLRNTTNSEKVEIEGIKTFANKIFAEVRKMKFNSCSNSCSNNTEIMRLSSENDINRMRIANLSLELELVRQSLRPTTVSFSGTGDVRSILQSLKSDINSLKTAGLNYESKLNFLLRNRKTKVQQSSTPAVAFLAYLTEPKHVYSPGDRIVFPHIDTNAGESYDNRTGVFTSPLSGIYTFSLSITSHSNSSEGYLMRNSQPVAHYSDSKDEGDFRQATLSLSLHLEAGDRIYALWYGKNQASLVYKFHHTYISGHLVNPDYNNAD